MGCSGSTELQTLDHNHRPESFDFKHNSQSQLIIGGESLQEGPDQQSAQHPQSQSQLQSQFHCHPNPLMLDHTTPSLAKDGTLAAAECESTLSAEDAAERKRKVRISNLRAELLNTERSYVKNLTTAMELLMLPILGDKIIDAETASDQFNDFIAIAKFNKIMLEELEERPRELVAVLRKYTPGLKLYTSYLQHFERRMHVRAKLVNNNALHSFYEKAREQHNFSLESYLVEPVQRIPRYKMLLAELHNCMLPGDDEHEIISAALQEVSSMALYHNDAIREMELRLEQSAAMMQAVTLSRINVFDDPTRHLVMSSFNLKCTSAGGNMRPLQIWLLNDKIIYGRNVVKKKIFKRMAYVEVPLVACNISSIPDDDEDSDDDSSLTSFIFESEIESFLIIANTLQEKVQWVEGIRKAIDARRRVSARTRSSSFVQMAPVWKLDDASNICDICSKQFGVRLRRRHCRLCGALVCNGCSSHRVALHSAGIAHTWSSSDLESSDAAAFDRKAKLQIERAKSKCTSGSTAHAEKKERVCTLCYNHLSCQYLQRQGEHGLRLEITLVSAYDLPNADVFSLSDPYVVFSCRNHSLRSRTIDDNLNPEWGTSVDRFCFAYEPGGGKGPGEGDGGKERQSEREISVMVYDEDPTIDDFLGSTVIDLNQYPGLDRGDLEKLDLPLEPPGSGSLQLDLRVIPVQSS